jgi:hypothetical protein
MNDGMLARVSHQHSQFAAPMGWTNFEACVKGFLALLDTL